jgi:hypothetical protein
MAFVVVSIAIWVVALAVIGGALAKAASADSAFRSCLIYQEKTGAICLDFAHLDRIVAVVTAGVALFAQAILTTWYFLRRHAKMEERARQAQR